jgi:hypothetical protein
MPGLSLIILAMTGNVGLKQIVSCPERCQREHSSRMKPLVLTEPTPGWSATRKLAGNQVLGSRGGKGQSRLGRLVDLKKRSQSMFSVQGRILGPGLLHRIQLI